MAKAPKENYEKKFYKKILKAIDKEDKNAFYKEFNNAIRSGKMVVSQKRSKGQLSFDSTWVEVLNRYMGNLESIVRNPRLYMMAEENVMPIQAAKKINARSVQHLSSHVQNVQEIRKDGTIVPSKILSVTYEDTLNIYENRFIMTLITKLAAFVEVRYKQVMDFNGAYRLDDLRVKDTFKWRNYDVEAEVNLKVKEQIEDAESKKNLEILEQISLIRSYLKGFMGSAFFTAMKQSGARPVVPPILRTNIIVKSVDYSSCLKLWQFLDSYRELGVEVGILDTDIDYDEDFLSDISDMLMFNYSLLAMNQDDRSETYDLLPYKYKRYKPPKVDSPLLQVSEVTNLPDSEIDMQDEPTISEYWYQRIKTNYKSQFTKEVNSGISYNKSFLNIYKNMLRIEADTQKDILTGMYARLKSQYPKRISYKARKQYLLKVRAIYKSLITLKTQELNKFKEKLFKTESELRKYERKGSKPKDIEELNNLVEENNE